MWRVGGKNNNTPPHPTSHPQPLTACSLSGVRLVQTDGQTNEREERAGRTNEQARTRENGLTVAAAAVVLVLVVGVYM